jgi:hypothetical protein
MTLQELETKVGEYLILADTGIIKLLCAVVIANRMPELDPLWLWIVSNSSGGKSELLQAMAFAKGCWEQDDLSAAALVSGAKNGAKETSLLNRLPQNPVMVIKDLTVLLNKDPKETAVVFNQLRMIYDGKIIKSFGTGEDVIIPIRMGLIAGTTSAIEELGRRVASLGERALRYQMIQPIDRIKLTVTAIKGKKDKQMREELGKAFEEFLDVSVQQPSDVPDLTEAEYQAIAELADMVTLARSAISRNQYARGNPMTQRHLREMPIRMAKMLVTLSRALMVLNNGPLTAQDREIVYKVATDSIPSGRREVMVAATEYHSITLEGLAMDLKMPQDTVKVDLDDLIAHELIDRYKGLNNKFEYQLQPKYKALMSEFRHIEMTDEKLDDTSSNTTDGLVDPGETQYDKRLSDAGLI